MKITFLGKALFYVASKFSKKHHNRAFSFDCHDVGGFSGLAYSTNWINCWRGTAIFRCAPDYVLTGNLFSFY